MSVGKYLTQQQRDELVNVRCTLDGKPAAVRGRFLPFAVITVLPAGYSVEYAWPTVARVVASGGEFES